MVAIMLPDRDVEKMGDVREPVLESEAPTLYSGELSESPATRRVAMDGCIGYPDIGYEVVAAMDAGHQDDLIRINTTMSLRAGQRKSTEILDRIDTGGSKRSRISRIGSKLSTKSRNGILDPERIPESDLKNGIVGWEGQNDPLMPLNFPDSRKWLLLFLVAAITFISPLASSMFAPAVGFMNVEFENRSEILSSLVVSIFVLGYVVGPLVLSPLSEIYGRRPVLGCANAFFCVWQIGCALSPDLNSLIVFRFLAGIGGSGCLTIGGGVIADLFRREQRGFATSIYSLGPLFGPVIGPVCGGFIAQRAGWRWIFWVLLAAGTSVTIMIEILNRETNPRVLIQQKTLRLREELNRPELRSCYDDPERPKLNKTLILKEGLLRPLKMFFRSPIIFLLSLYMSVVYGLLYLLFTTITPVFSNTYAWSPEMCGLAFISLGVGFVAGLLCVVHFSDRTVIRMTTNNNGIFEPEMRLPSCVFFAVFIPISLFWYGWTSYHAVHWIVPILGLVPFGFGTIGIFIPIQTYIIDAFPTFAASAVAALTASRSLFGALLPLAAPKMYDTLGLGWGNSLLGFVAVALIPAPALIYKHGGWIRREWVVRL